MNGLIGKSIAGRYKIVSKLGDGGMGVVYKAIQTSVDRTVAVKILHPHLMSNTDAMQRFQREAKTCSKLKDANAIHLYDFGIENHLTYLVMEYIEGQSLRDMLQPGKPLQLRRAANLIGQICSALAEAHALDIVHRDLKPGNIMITRRRNREHVKVVDFGIAKIVSDETKATHMTQTGMIIGTPQYMSPEQAEGGKIDLRSDIYSLGIILYELVTGDTPFQADTPLQLLLKHVKDPPPPPRKLRPDLDIPEAVEAVILKALAKRPQDRYDSAEALAAELDQATRHLPLPDLAPLPATSGKPGRSSAGSGVAATDIEIDPTEIGINQTEIAGGGRTAIEPPPRPAWLMPALAAALLVLAGVAYYFLSGPGTGYLTLYVSPHEAAVSVTSPEVDKDDIKLLKSARETGSPGNLAAVRRQQVRIIPVRRQVAKREYRYELPAGDYTISATADGYADYRTEVTIDPDRADTVEVSLIYLGETGGKVGTLGRDGANLSTLQVKVIPEDATVIVYAANNRLLQYRPKSRSGGLVNFDLPPDYTYTVTVSKQGYHSQTRSVNVSSENLLTFTEFALVRSIADLLILDKDKVNNSAAGSIAPGVKPRLLGQRSLNLFWFTTSGIGSISSALEIQDGANSLPVYSPLPGLQEKYVRLGGKIVSLTAQQLVFEGTLTFRHPQRNNGQPCERTGRFTFEWRSDNEARWALVNNSAICDGIVDGINIK